MGPVRATPVITTHTYTHTHTEIYVFRRWADVLIHSSLQWLMHTHTSCMLYMPGTLCVCVCVCVCVCAWASDGWESLGSWITSQTQKHNEHGCNLSFWARSHTHTDTHTLSQSERLIKKLSWADSRTTTYTTSNNNKCCSDNLGYNIDRFRILQKMNEWKVETQTNTYSPTTPTLLTEMVL